MFETSIRMKFPEFARCKAVDKLRYIHTVMIDDL